MYCDMAPIYYDMGVMYYDWSHINVHCYPDSNHYLGSLEARRPCAVTEVMVHGVEVIVHGAGVIVYVHMA